MKQTRSTALLIASALAFSGWLCGCTTLSKENAAAKSDYKADVTSCSELTGVEHSMCIEDANKDMQSSVDNAYNAMAAAAEADYKAAVVKRKEIAVDARNDCIKQANAVKETALGKAQKGRSKVLSVEKKPVTE